MVPFRLVRPDLDRRVILIDSDRVELLRLAVFDPSRETRTLSTLIGVPFQLPVASPFGRVEDFVISERGRLDFVVVASEQKLIAVPVSLARLDFAHRLVTTELERERLLRAPRFAKDRFPDLSMNSEFSRRVHSFFQVRGDQQGRTKEAVPPAVRLAEQRPPQARPPEQPPPMPRPAEPRPRPPETQPPMPRPRPPEGRPPEPRPRPPEEHNAPNDLGAR